MTRKKQSPGASLVRFSAAEYLTFVAASGGGGVEAAVRDFRIAAADGERIRRIPGPEEKGRTRAARRRHRAVWLAQGGSP